MHQPRPPKAASALSGVVVNTPPTARILQGRIYLDREICEAYLPGVETVALIERDGLPVIVPLIGDNAGGLLLKLRNRQGDRVIDAQEFFRVHGYLEDFQERKSALRWDKVCAALMLLELPRVVSPVQGRRCKDALHSVKILDKP
jgi:hypothetical protein